MWRVPLSHCFVGPFRSVLSPVRRAPSLCLVEYDLNIQTKLDSNYTMSWRTTGNVCTFLSFYKRKTWNSAYYWSLGHFYSHYATTIINKSIITPTLAKEKKKRWSTFIQPLIRLQRINKLSSPAAAAALQASRHLYVEHVNVCLCSCPAPPHVKHLLTHTSADAYSLSLCRLPVVRAPQAPQ